MEPEKELPLDSMSNTNAPNGAGDTSPLHKSVWLCSLLNQFRETRVRSLFLAGKLDDCSNNLPDLLLSIDQVRDLICPRYTGTVDYTLAEQHINSLLSQEDEDFIEVTSLGDGAFKVIKSYKQWMKYLRYLGGSSVWECLASGFMENLETVEEHKPSLTRSERSKVNRQTKFTPIAEREEDDSSSSTEQSSTDTDDSDDSRDDISPERTSKTSRRPSKEISLAKALHGLQYPREVVKPIVFDSQSCKSLKNFLKCYEKYFSAAFKGSEKDMSRQLKQFLTGEIALAYEALNGDAIKYSKLKPLLLDWYRQSKVSMTVKWKQEFKNAKMHEDESFKIFGLRLEQLARKAYPDSEKERKKELKRKYCKSVPIWFARKLENSEGIVALLGHNKKLTWEMVMSLADSEDRHTREHRLTNEGIPSKPSNSSWGDRAMKPNDKSSRIYRNTNITFGKNNNQQGSGRRPNNKKFQYCTWCGRKNHDEEHCRVKAGLCLICGKVDHSHGKCPDSYSNRAPVLKCSNCGGGHLGMNCSEHTTATQQKKSQDEVNPLN